MINQLNLDFESQRAAASEDVLRKIRALLALAGSPNEYEAALAMMRANQLLTKYNLNMAELQAGEFIPSGMTHEILEVKCTLRDWHRALVCGVADHCLVKPIRSGSRYMLVGTPTNIAALRMLFAWVLRQLQRISLASTIEHVGRGKRATKWRNRFCMGAALRISARLNEPAALPDKTDDRTPGLILAHTTAADDYCENKGWKLKDVRKKTFRPSSALYAGYTAGGLISLKPAKLLQT